MSEEEELRDNEKGVWHRTRFLIRLFVGTAKRTDPSVFNLNSIFYVLRYNSNLKFKVHSLPLQSNLTVFLKTAQLLQIHNMFCCWIECKIASRNLALPANSFTLLVFNILGHKSVTLLDLKSQSYYIFLPLTLILVGLAIRYQQKVTYAKNIYA